MFDRFSVDKYRLDQFEIPLIEDIERIIDYCMMISLPVEYFPLEQFQSREILDQIDRLR